MPDPLVIDVLLEFLEAFVHQLLFVRGVYASQLFERRRLYGIAIRRARHPDLCSYVSDVVASLRAPLTQGTLAKVAISIVSPSRQPLERFVIEPLVHFHTNSGPDVTESGVIATHHDVSAIEAQLRAAMLKLQYVDALLTTPTVPEGSTFQIVAYSAGRVGIDPELWAEHQADELEEGGLALQRGEIIPLKTCKVDNAFRLQVYAETPGTAFV